MTLDLHCRVDTSIFPSHAMLAIRQRFLSSISTLVKHPLASISLLTLPLLTCSYARPALARPDNLHTPGSPLNQPASDPSAHNPESPPPATHTPPSHSTPSHTGTSPAPADTATNPPSKTPRRPSCPYTHAHQRPRNGNPEHPR